MNSVDPMTAPGGPGYGMRAFLVVIMFVMAFLIFINGSMKGVNLTSNTAGAAVAAPVQAAAPTETPQVITIQEGPATTNQGNLSVPVTGGCSDPYPVQPGDSLLQIAINCNITLAAIRQANPQVTNANLIYPGQQLNIPGGNTVAQAQPSEAVPLTGKDISQATATPFVIQSAPTALVPLTGAYPLIAAGTGLEVKGIGYPANTPVNVAIGPQNQGYTLVANGVTDVNGNLTTHITIPQAQNAQTPYVVVIATTGTAPVQAMSRPFYIGPAQ
jgi:LysM repeat protein